MESEYEQEAISEIGYRVPISNTAAGKAVLAFLPPAEQEQLLNKTTADKNPEKRTAQNPLSKELLEIKKKGYAVSNEEFKKGFCAVATPLFNYTQKVIGAVAVVMPLTRTNSEHIAELGNLLVVYGDRMSLDLGYKQ